MDAILSVRERRRPNPLGDRAGSTFVKMVEPTGDRTGDLLLGRQEVTKAVASDPLRDALSQEQELSSPGFDPLVPICAQ